MDQDGNPQGVFRDSGDGSTTDRADDFIPGIPGLEGSTDNMAAEILTFIEFPEAGYYTMIFNSDDGFLVSETHGAGDSRGSTLGVFNGGRGASDTTFGLRLQSQVSTPFVPFGMKVAVVPTWSGPLWMVSACSSTIRLLVA